MVCPTMIAFEELFFLFGAGAVIVVALCLYNMLGKSKQKN